MNRITFPMVILGWSIAAIVGWAGQPTLTLQGIVETESKMTDAELAHLDAKLQNLQLSDAKVTDAGLVHLSGCPNSTC